jgi:hypothetical protein
MKAVRGTYSKGKIQLKEPAPDSGPVDVLVVFPESSDDSWAAILSEPKVRPSLARFVKKCKADIAAGKAKALDLDQL